MPLVGRLCAPARIAAIVKHRAQTFSAAQAWSRHLKVDVEHWSAQKPSVARKKTLALASSVGPVFTKACLMIMAVTKSHVLRRIVVIRRLAAMTIGALQAWFVVVRPVVVALDLALMTSAACQRQTAAITCVPMACSLSQMLGLVVQPVAQTISVVRLRRQPQHWRAVASVFIAL